MNDEHLTNTTLRDYIRVLFRHKSVIMLTILTVCVTVFAGLKLKTRVYESRVKMLITAEKQVEATYYREMYGSNRTQQTLTQSEIVKSDPVLGRVVRSLALHKRPVDDEKKFSSPLKAMLIDYQIKAKEKTFEGLTDDQKDAITYRQAIISLKKNIRVEPIRDTNMFTITVSDYNPVGAAIIANVVSRSYVIFDLEQQLAELKLKYGRKHPTVNLIEESIAVLMKTLSGELMDDIEAIGPASVKIIEQASVALKPSGTSKTLTLALAFIMSIFLAVMLAFIFEYSDQTMKSPEDITRTLGFPFIGSIAKKKMFNKPLVEFDKKLSNYGNSYQVVGDQLYMMIKDKGLKVLLLTSTLKEENNAVVIANLGNYISKMLKCKMLIIDANLRAPSMGRLFNIGEESGLADFLDGKADLKEVTKKLGGNLSVIASGSTDLNPIILMESPKMKELLIAARKEYELVIISAPHMSGQKDTAILSAFVDGTVLVIDEGKARRQVVKSVTMNMNGKLEKTIGVILNERTSPIPKFIYESI